MIPEAELDAAGLPPLKVPQPDGMRRSAETFEVGDLVACVAPREGWDTRMPKGSEHVVSKAHDDWLAFEDTPNTAWESGAFVVIRHVRPSDMTVPVAAEYSLDAATWIRVEPGVVPPFDRGWKRLVFPDGSRGSAKRMSNPYAALRDAQPSLPVDHDPVEHPAHYRLASGVEVIDLTEQLDFLRGNAVKYLARAGRKDGADELEDLRKAAWYANRAVAKLERERAE